MKFSDSDIASLMGSAFTLLAAIMIAVILRAMAARPPASAAPEVHRTFEETLRYGRFAMECLVTISVLSAGLYVMAFGAGSPDSQKWASGVVGAVIGFWLRGTQNGFRNGANGNGGTNGCNGYDGQHTRKPHETERHTGRHQLDGRDWPE